MAWNNEYHPSSFKAGKAPIPYNSTDWTGGEETPEAFYLPPKGRFYNVDDFNYNWNKAKNLMDVERDTRGEQYTEIQEQISTEEKIREQEDNAIRENMQDELALKEDKANKNAANGYAALDGDGKVPLSQIPPAILGQMTYAGTFTATSTTQATATLSSNAKTLLEVTVSTITLLSSGTGTKPISVGASQNQGNYYLSDSKNNFAGLDFNSGDMLVATENAWKKIDNTDAITDELPTAITNEATPASPGTSTNVARRDHVHGFTAITASTIKTSLSATNNTDTTMTTLAVSENTIASAFQTIWNKIRSVVNGLNAHTTNTNNPHGVTQTQVGLGNVKNKDTTDASNIESGTLGEARLPSLTIAASTTSTDAGTTAKTAMINNLLQWLREGLTYLKTNKQDNLNRTVNSNDNSTTDITDTGGAISVPLAVTITAGTATDTLPASNSKVSLRSWLTVIRNNVTWLMTNKQNTVSSIIGNDNASAANTTTTGAVTVPIPVTISTPSASNTQLTSGTKTLRSAITTVANNIAHLFSNKEDKANKNAANGYAALDGDGKVPLSQIPDNYVKTTGDKMTGTLTLQSTLVEEGSSSPTLTEPVLNMQCYGSDLTLQAHSTASLGNLYHYSKGETTERKLRSNIWFGPDENANKDTAWDFYGGHWALTSKGGTHGIQLAGTVVGICGGRGLYIGTSPISQFLSNTLPYGYMSGSLNYSSLILEGGIGIAGSSCIAGTTIGLGYLNYYPDQNKKRGLLMLGGSNQFYIGTPSGTTDDDYPGHLQIALTDSSLYGNTNRFELQIPNNHGHMYALWNSSGLSICSRMVKQPTHTQIAPVGIKFAPYQSDGDFEINAVARPVIKFDKGSKVKGSTRIRHISNMIKYSEYANWATNCVYQKYDLVRYNNNNYQALKLMYSTTSNRPSGTNTSTDAWHYMNATSTFDTIVMEAYVGDINFVKRVFHAVDISITEPAVWSTNMRYAEGDWVKYPTSTSPSCYVKCKTTHTASNGSPLSNIGDPDGNAWWYQPISSTNSNRPQYRKLTLVTWRRNNTNPWGTEANQAGFLMRPYTGSNTISIFPSGQTQTTILSAYTLSSFTLDYYSSSADADTAFIVYFADEVRDLLNNGDETIGFNPDNGFSNNYGNRVLAHKTYGNNYRVGNTATSLETAVFATAENWVATTFGEPIDTSVSTTTVNLFE